MEIDLFGFKVGKPEKESSSYETGIKELVVPLSDILRTLKINGNVIYSSYDYKTKKLYLKIKDT